MHQNDPDLLLKFAAAMKILLAGTIDVQSLSRAQELPEAYLAGFLKIICNFGPMYGFWTFLFKHLKKLLKSYDINNHGDRELEVGKLVNKAGIEGLTPEEQCIVESACEILTTDGETHGTVAAMACEVEELSSDPSVSTSFAMGMAVLRPLSLPLQQDILYNRTYPDIPIIDRTAEVAPHTTHFFLHGTSQVHDSSELLDHHNLPPFWFRSTGVALANPVWHPSMPTHTRTCASARLSESPTHRNNLSSPLPKLPPSSSSPPPMRKAAPRPSDSSTDSDLSVTMPADSKYAYVERSSSKLPTLHKGELTPLVIDDTELVCQQQHGLSLNHIVSNDGLV
ncbi:hypothetical protein DFH09DRAFT_1470391 [Mycena vulgaris]|nr:hypothetical protein DFH09DRAFT_1470391 [Mycena vulgaris]